MKTLRLRVHDASNISIIIMISDCSIRRKKREPYKNNKKKLSQSGVQNQHAQCKDGLESGIEPRLHSLKASTFATEPFLYETFHISPDQMKHVIYHFT